MKLNKNNFMISSVLAGVALCVVALSLFVVPCLTNKDMNVSNDAATETNHEAVQVAEQSVASSDLPKTVSEVNNWAYDLSKHSADEYLTNALNVLKEEPAEQNKEAENHTNNIFQKNNIAKGIGQNVDDTLYYKIEDTTLYISKYGGSGYSETSTVGIPAWREEEAFKANTITKAVFQGTGFAPVNTIAWFGVFEDKGEVEELSNLTTIENLGNLNMSNVTDASLMFAGCNSLDETTQAAISKLDFTHVTNAFGLFAYTNIMDSYMQSATSSLLKVTNLSFTYYGCSALTSINVGHFDFSNITNMSCMFSNSTALKEVTYMGDKVASKVVSANDMFYGCTNLTDVDTSNLFKDNNSAVTTTAGMFEYTKIPSLDVSLWTFPSLTDARDMFANNKSLSYIAARPGKDWSQQTKVTGEKGKGMFTGCTKLANYSSSDTNINFAKINQEGGTKGYFSAIYDITITGDEAKGSGIANPNPAKVGDTVTLKPEPKSGWMLDSWQSPDVTISNNQFTMPAKNVAISVNFKEDPNPRILNEKADGSGFKYAPIFPAVTSGDVSTKFGYHFFTKNADNTFNELTGITNMSQLKDYVGEGTQGQLYYLLDPNICKHGYIPTVRQADKLQSYNEATNASIFEDGPHQKYVGGLEKDGENWVGANWTSRDDTSRETPYILTEYGKQAPSWDVSISVVYRAYGENIFPESLEYRTWSCCGYATGGAATAIALKLDQGWNWPERSVLGRIVFSRCFN